MAKNQFAEPHFHNEEAARAWFEAARWPNGALCPKCGSAKHYATKKAGVYRCAASTCRKDFTVMTGTVMERSHAKLTQWAAAFHLAASSKKGFSAHQLHRELGCQYNTAWFLHHRVMEAMRRGGLDLPPMGGEGKVVEVDETYYANIPEAKRPTKTTLGKPLSKQTHYVFGRKRAVIALVERGGEVRSVCLARMPIRWSISCARTSPAKAACIRTKANFTAKSDGSSRNTKPSTTPRRNMRAVA
jgi:transposase-like protein